MSEKSIEVEIRGPLNDKSYKNIISILNREGKLIKKQNRFLLDYSTFLEGIGERKTDIRIRKTNGKVEIIVKKGKFGGPSREEVSIFPEGNSLKNTLRLMSYLGFEKAIACDRSITRYEIGEIEFAIQDVNDFNNQGKIHSRFFEAEILCSNNEEKEIAIEKIRKFIAKLRLQEFSEEEWNQYISMLNHEANGVFNYQLDDIDRISSLGN